MPQISKAVKATTITIAIMLRGSFLSSSPSSVCNKYILVVATLGKWNNGVLSRSFVTTTTTTLPTHSHQRLHFRSSLLVLSSRNCISCNLQKTSSSLRMMSSSGSNKSDQTGASSSSSSTNNTAKDGDGKQQPTSDSNEIVLTPGETVVAVSRLTMWAGIAAFAVVCGYYIAMELIPTKMSPNRIFDRSFDVVRKDPDVLRRYGESIKAYGRDHGGHREGRRNFIEHTEYVDKEDGSKRVRVRYNIEGRFGQAFVFAEVSANQPSGEFVYVLVQDKANGQTQTIVDNRAAMTAARLMGNNKEAGSAISQLLTGSGSKK